MGYATRKDGQGWRAVDNQADVGSEETYSEIQPGPIELTQAQIILGQIVALESTVTDRRIREAVLGIDGGWLNSLNDQIAALRVKMVV